jgi:hypothetical protein
MDKSNKGFAGKWVDIFSTGTHTDDKGNSHVIDVSFLESVAGNLNPALHEPPAVIGHPDTDAPAYGWVDGLRVDGDLLQAQFYDVDPDFEEIVRKGRYKKRSASFYLDATLAPGGRVPSLRHVGFLGAKPPAVKGLRNVDFNEGEAITFEDINFSEGESMTDDEKVKTTVRESIAEFFKDLFSSKDKTPANFSEADVKRIAAEAAQAETASFAEENKTLKAQLEELKTQVATQSGVTTRGQIVAFCESLGKSKFPPAFMNLGAVEFMERLATLPGDVKVSVVSFEETAGTKKEIKTESTLLKWFQDFLTNIGPVVQFGEQFSNLSGNAETPTDPDDVNKVKKGMGITQTEGGAK